MPEVSFDENGRLPIYDASESQSAQRLNFAVPLTTAMSGYILYLDSEESVITSRYAKLALQLYTIMGTSALFLRSFDKRSVIDKIELLKHEDHEKYCSEMALTLSNGKEMRLPIKNIYHSSNNEY
jgi:hypothetical protein